MIVISVPIPRTPRSSNLHARPPRSHPRRRSIRTPDPYQRSIGLEHETLVRFHPQAHCAGAPGGVSVARGPHPEGRERRGPQAGERGARCEGPIDPLQVPRFAGPATFARLPRSDEVERCDVAIVGVPFDGGTTFRPGARFGPIAVRQATRLLRELPPRPRRRAVRRAAGRRRRRHRLQPVRHRGRRSGRSKPGPRRSSRGRRAHRDDRRRPHDRASAAPGGEAPARGPVALVHFDAHLDTWDTYFGAPYTHGTPFRRAWEEGLLLEDHAATSGSAARCSRATTSSTTRASASRSSRRWTSRPGSRRRGRASPQRASATRRSTSRSTSTCSTRACARHRDARGRRAHQPRAARDPAGARRRTRSLAPTSSRSRRRTTTPR